MLPAGVKVWVAAEPVNMRQSFDGLSARAQSIAAQDVFSGHLFVFCNRRADKLKVLYWDRTGLALWYKRLERGAFRLPRVQQAKAFSLSVAELGLLLEGIDLTDRNRFASLYATALN